MRLYTLLVIALALLLCGCPPPPGGDGDGTGASGNGDGSGNQAVARTEYRYPLPGNITNLDPAFITDTVSDAVARRIFNMLLKFGMNGEILPDLAESYEISEDGLEYTFTLREGVRFHNGDVLTAEDVHFTYTRLLDPEVASPRGIWIQDLKGAREFMNGEADSVSGIEVVDERTIKLTLTEPNAPFLKVICMTNLAIVPKNVVIQDPDGFNDRPVGTGPFVFSSLDRQDRCVVKANRDYFDKAPSIETLIFRVISDETTRFELFKNGELEHCDIKPSKIDEVMADDSLKAMIQGEPAQDMYALGFNCDAAPFKDNTTLRLAFNHAIDKSNIVDNVWSGLVTRQDTYVPAGMFYFWDDAPGYPYDPDKAATLLEQAGYPGGEGLPELVLTVDVEATNKRVAEAVMHDLAQIGVRIRIETMQKSELIKKNDDGELIFFQNTWLGDYPDPDNWLWQLLCSDNFGAKGNHARWQNSEFDNLVRRARVETNEAMREELYGQAEKIAHTEAPWLPLIWKDSATLVQPWVRGLQITKYDRTPELNHAPMEEVTLAAQ